jgi:hypothetical protein
MRPNNISFARALRNVLFAGLVSTTVALGPLRDALVYVPNGAEVDHGATASTPVFRRAQ